MVNGRVGGVKIVLSLLPELHKTLVRAVVGAIAAQENKKLMLSVLIPVYQWDCRQLVSELLRQGRQLACPFEIRLYDDGSVDGCRLLNRELSAQPEVVYWEAPANLGRAGIRNKLAAEALYEWLLFIDADSGVVRDDFLAVYVSYARSPGIICGGRVYAARPPADRSHYLHWLFGRRRESYGAGRRRRDPLLGFMTNNYMIARSLQQSFPFHASLRTYGHEDTLLGAQLKQAGISICHIDNPLRHEGLETADVFLQKQQAAIRNLCELSQSHPSLNTRLLFAVRLLQRLGLLSPGYYLLRPLAGWLSRRLQQQPGTLLWLDLLKIYWLADSMRKPVISAANS